METRGEGGLGKIAFETRRNSKKSVSAQIFIPSFRCCLHKVLDFPSQQKLPFPFFSLTSSYLQFLHPESYLLTKASVFFIHFSWDFNRIEVQLYATSFSSDFSFIFSSYFKERKTEYIIVCHLQLPLSKWKRYGREGEGQRRCQGSKVRAEIFGSARRLIK